MICHDMVKLVFVCYALMLVYPLLGFSQVMHQATLLYSPLALAFCNKNIALTILNRAIKYIVV